MRSIFFLAALALLFATTTSCPEAVAQDDLTGKWLRFDWSLCVTSFKDGAKKEDEKCFEDWSILGVTTAGHHWLGTECPRNSTTPPHRTYSKTDRLEETLIGRTTCATDGPRTTLTRSTLRKDISPQISLTQVAKLETVLSFESSDSRCRVLNYSRTIHAVNSEGVRQNGERIPATIEDYKYRMDKLLRCRIVSSEKEALALELK